MACNQCKETSCILDSTIDMHTHDLSVRLRLDLDNPENPNFDIQILNHEAQISEWTDSVSFKYCPFCGEYLVGEMI